MFDHGGWFLSRVGQICTGCRQWIPETTPVRRLRSGRVRCATCAMRVLGEAVPPDLHQPKKEQESA
jgi:hypothetical protein